LTYMTITSEVLVSGVKKVLEKVTPICFTMRQRGAETGGPSLDATTGTRTRLLQ
jgi:hypothetical protein